MTPSPAFRMTARRLCSDASSKRECSRRDALPALARNPPRSDRSKMRKRSAGGVLCRSPGQISYAASQRKAEHRFVWECAVRWGSTQMVSAIGVITVVLYLLRRNQNVFSILPAPRIDITADVLDF